MPLRLPFFWNRILGYCQIGTCNYLYRKHLPSPHNPLSSKLPFADNVKFTWLLIAFRSLYWDYLYICIDLQTDMAAPISECVLVTTYESAPTACLYCLLFCRRSSPYNLTYAISLGVLTSLHCGWELVRRCHLFFCSFNLHFFFSWTSSFCISSHDAGSGRGAVETIYAKILARMPLLVLAGIGCKQFSFLFQRINHWCWFNFNDVLFLFLQYWWWGFLLRLSFRWGWDHDFMRFLTHRHFINSYISADCYLIGV